jgi:membrane associated rhomboid family serine protease
MIKGNGERTLTPKTYRYQEAKSKIAPAKRTSVPGEKRWTPEELKREHGIHRRIQKKRKNLLWPGLFTVVSIAGIYYGFAYLDERFDLQDNDLAPAARRSQSWYLTPTVVSEGFVNYWKELDKMTIGVMALYFGLHLVKRMPNKFWEKLPHIAGERTWTLATYSLVHSSNQGVFSAIFYLAWFMPAVVRYFDGDYLHLSAFYFSVPILLGVLTHLRFKGKNAIRGIPVEMGSSGALSALVGAYTMINPWEKVWFVVTGPFRVDAIYIAGGMVLNEIWRMYKLRGTGLPATISHSVSD